MRIEAIELIEKSGGRTGRWVRPRSAAPAARARATASAFRPQTRRMTATDRPSRAMRSAARGSASRSPSPSPACEASAMPSGPERPDQAGRLVQARPGRRRGRAPRSSPPPARCGRCGRRPRPPAPAPAPPRSPAARRPPGGWPAPGRGPARPRAPGAAARAAISSWREKSSSSRGVPLPGPTGPMAATPRRESHSGSSASRASGAAGRDPAGRDRERREGAQAGPAERSSPRAVSLLPVPAQVAGAWPGRRGPASGQSAPATPKKRRSATSRADRARRRGGGRRRTSSRHRGPPLAGAARWPPPASRWPGRSGRPGGFRTGPSSSSTRWPRASSAWRVASWSAPGSATITSGLHWWWMRGVPSAWSSGMPAVERRGRWPRPPWTGWCEPPGEPTARSSLPSGAEDQRGRHRGERALARGRQVHLPAHEAEGVRHAGSGVEVVHLVVEQDAGPRDHHAANRTGRFTVVVSATALPSASTTDTWEVWPAGGRRARRVGRRGPLPDPGPDRAREGRRGHLPAPPRRRRAAKSGSAERAGPPREEPLLAPRRRRGGTAPRIAPRPADPRCPVRQDNLGTLANGNYHFIIYNIRLNGYGALRPA